MLIHSLTRNSLSPHHGSGTIPGRVTSAASLLVGGVKQEISALVVSATRAKLESDGCRVKSMVCAHGGTVLSLEGDILTCAPTWVNLENIMPSG